MENKNVLKGFIPYALAAFLVGIVGGFSTVLGPAFVADLGLDYNNTTWTALAQAMSTAAFAPVLGKLGDLLGSKKALLLGLALFTLGNILTARATGLGFMLAARFIVGIGSAAISPVIMAYILTHFPKEKVATGFSLYMLISSASVVLGPTAGSWIISRWGWRSMIYLCVTICALVLTICLLFKGKEMPQQKDLAHFDSWGSIFVLLFFSLLLCLPSFGQNFGWKSPAFRLVLLGNILTLGLLIFAEKNAKNPILPGRFIGRKTFVLCIVALFLTQGLMQANMTNIIVFVNYTHPGRSLLSGYAISVMYLAMSLGAILLGPLADRHPPKTVLAFSLLLTGLGCGTMLLFTAQTRLTMLMMSLGILGFGLGAGGTLFLKIALSGLSPQLAGAGTGTYGLFRDLAAPFGVAVLVPLFTNGISDLTAAGYTPAMAAVSSVHTLAWVELLCVAGGLVAIGFLPSHK